ncbi:MAG: aminotransferase class V-fold PLP-dependent enzyme, partial [Anaerolineales bacterium]|nr:aminotransferase class V-fold PLP-dependent enzyme [Anaerolineales bacterium]
SERTDDPVCGTVSSGGTESILLAMKTYRDWARATKGITAPEIIAPVTAHAAFDKAAQYFGLRLVRTPLDGDYAADVAAVEAAITPNTVAMIGSAPSFPHGVVDPIEALSELARARGIGFHTDGCLGGFLLPWAERLGFPVPAFDFRLPGVTSISADTHKFGYAAKGSSVVLYRTPDLRRYQYYATADWPGGLYFSPTFAGSRPGALSAVCWAAMMSIGEQGYLQAAKRILETTAWLREGVAGIPGLHLIGRSLFIVAFASHEVDVYAVLDALAKKQWNLNGLQNPASLHLCITQRHTQPGVAEAFIADLQAAVEHVRRNPQDKGTMGAVYGLAGSVPVKSLVADFLKTYIDLMYRVD